MAELIIGLAEQWYLREHGTMPPSAEWLVGRYLEGLPEGYDPALPRPGPRPLFWPKPGSEGPFGLGGRP